MKIIPIQLVSHCQKEATSLTYLWLLKRRLDGLVLGFTSLDRELMVGDQLYHAGGFEPSAMSSSSDLSVDGLDVEGSLKDALLIDGVLDPEDRYISEADMIGGKWDKAEVWLMRCNWRKPEDGVEILARGDLGEIQCTNGFRAELRGLGQALQQPVGLNFEPACNHDFGDRMCRVDKSLHTFTGGVTALSGMNDVFTDTSRTEAAGDFDGGEFRWLSGRNAGFGCEVKGSSGAFFVLQEIMPYDIAVGDTYRVTRGCDKVRDGDCLNKYANTINHGGFADLPGRDRFAALSSGSAESDEG